MLEMLLSFVMNVIITIIDFVLSPFMSALFALFPSTTVFFNYIFDFLSSSVTFVPSLLRLFLFTPSMFLLLFDYYIIKYSIHLLITSIKFAVNMYNKFKP